MRRAPDGQCYVLAPMEGWVGFDVGRRRGFAEEVRRTSQNEKLMKILAQRARRKKGKLSLAPNNGSPPSGKGTIAQEIPILEHGSRPPNTSQPLGSISFEMPLKLLTEGHV
jgi:hypothetical protein